MSTWVVRACARLYLRLARLANISETLQPIVVKLRLQICDNIDFHTVSDFQVKS